MKKRITKTISILMVCVLSIILMSTSAFANTSSPPYKTPKIYGYYYSFTSEVWDRYLNPPTVEAVAQIEARNLFGLTNVPIGYMGGQARLFNSSGSLKASSSMTYNNYSCAVNIVYSPRISTPGQYYAQNKAEFYNGNGYTTYTGYKSPILTLSSSKSASTTETSEVINDLMLQTEYSLNSNGETYGSALSEYTIGVEPDLISAVGTNGAEGYVRANDLKPNVYSIKQAIEQTGNNGDIRTIAIYDVDGTTVLGEFELITHYELVTDAE